MGSAALADFSPIQHASSGSEPDLWEIFDVVAPIIPAAGAARPTSMPIPAAGASTTGGLSTTRYGRMAAAAQRHGAGESLNAPTAWDPDYNDRMVTLDASGLDIYPWDFDDSTDLIESSVSGPAWTIAFDPGKDDDYQDMLVLIQGTNPVPIPPGAALLRIFGLAEFYRNTRKHRQL